MARPKSIQEPKNALKKIGPRHEEIMRRLLAGATQKEISIAMNYSQSRLCIIIGSPMFSERLKELEEETTARLVERHGDLKMAYRADSKEAYEVQKELMRSDNVNPSVRNDIAGQIQDRAGYDRKGIKDAGQNIVVITNIDRGKNDEPETVEIEVQDGGNGSR